MVKLGFLHLYLGNTLEPPDAARRNKTVFFFRDESTFNSNDDQNLREDHEKEKQRSWYYGIRLRFLALNDGEYEDAKKTNPNIKKYATEFLEGYWTMKKFIAQIESC